MTLLPKSSTRRSRPTLGSLLAVVESEGILDPVDPALVGKIDLRFIDAPATCPLGRAKRLLHDPAALHEFLLENKPPLSFAPSSRKHVKFVSELLSSGIATKERKRCRGFAKFFTVVKKVNEEGINVLRTILDCRTANETFIQPDPVNLPSLHEILTAFRSVDSMRALDLRHMYHQVLIGDHLRPFFCVAIGSLRLLWNVLAMGWMWACFIAQAISTYAVAGDAAFDWTEIPRVIRLGECAFFVVYDNVLGGGPRDELSEHWSDIRRRLEDPLHATVKEDLIAVDGTALEVLGLSWTPSSLGLSWSLLPKFTAKLSQSASLEHEPTLPLKTIARLLGLVAWGRYATHGDLFDLVPCYRVLADGVACQGWSGSAGASSLGPIFRAMEQLLAVGPQSFTDAHDEVVVFSDAHVTGFGFVGGEPVVSRSGCWNVVHQSKDMFFLEAIAAKMAVSTLARPRRLVNLIADNQALVHAVRKRSTACPRTAQVLRELFEDLRSVDCLITPHWIPTDFNPADELSRQKPLSSLKLREAPAHVLWTSPQSPQWGSKLGRVVGPTRC
eukprot:PhM_4_TR18715/c1_g4_i2/m.62386